MNVLLLYYNIQQIINYALYFINCLCFNINSIIFQKHKSIIAIIFCFDHSLHSFKDRCNKPIIHIWKKPKQFVLASKVKQLLNSIWILSIIFFSMMLYDYHLYQHLNMKRYLHIPFWNSMTHTFDFNLTIIFWCAQKYVVAWSLLIDKKWIVTKSLYKLQMADVVVTLNMWC